MSAEQNKTVAEGRIHSLLELDVHLPLARTSELLGLRPSDSDQDLYHQLPILWPSDLNGTIPLALLSLQLAEGRVGTWQVSPFIQ